MCRDNMMGNQEMLSLFFDKKILRDLSECDEYYFEMPIVLTEMKTFNSTEGENNDAL
jgi:hypothetical protein